MRKLSPVFPVLIIISVLSSCVSVEEKEYVMIESDEPAPYQDDEFPGWMTAIRRAEIIFAGSIPITILASNVAYSLYGTISADRSTGSEISDFTSSAAMTNEEKTRVLSTAIAISGGIALTDFILGLFEKNEE